MKRVVFWSMVLVSIFNLFSTNYSLADELKVLVFDSNRSGFLNDFVTVSQLVEVAGETLQYTQTEDLAGEVLNDYNIVWVGHAEICEDGYFLSPDTEKNIESFVKSGGTFVALDQDNDNCQTTWLPLPLEIVEAGDHVPVPTDEAEDLFEVPNEVDLAAPRLDDNYANFDNQYVVLAEDPGADAADLVLLEYGSGAYLLAAVGTESAQEAEAASPLFENMLHFIISRGYGLAVEPSGKTAVIWGQLRKSGVRKPCPRAKRRISFR